MHVLEPRNYTRATIYISTSVASANVKTKIIFYFYVNMQCHTLGCVFFVLGRAVWFEVWLKLQSRQPRRFPVNMHACITGQLKVYSTP